ncbi:MAG: molybdenum cofactor biosynthesis protein MoaE [Nocardioidaceae bacterium]|nr:molybdenum cofactor biosynthesis protein MoaE [Nocardioidaceae bacterium]
MTEAVDRVRLAEISEQPLDVAAVHSAVAADGIGGICLFVGTVRDHDRGRGVVALGYSAHPTALTQLRRVAAEVAERFDAPAVAAVHRVGELAVGDLAVVVAVATPHRDAAFSGCRALIDELKATVPIWKHQVFTDGSDEWVGTP